MNPLGQFCHNPDCSARGQAGPGNILVYSQKDKRYRCTTCRRTFAATADTPFYRLKVGGDIVALILTLLNHDCPLQAIVAAFVYDDRTVAAWRDRAGCHAQQFHLHQVLQGRVELGHVQADELLVRAAYVRLWTALAMAVPSRLWHGGVVSVRRDGRLITADVRMVRQAAKTYSFLVCVDGLASYITAFDRVFRDPVRTDRRGRPRLTAIGGLLLGQLIKHHSGRRLVSITRREVRGTAAAITAAVVSSGTGTDVNTAYIERPIATFRARLCPLARRGRATVRSEAVLT